MDYPKGMSEELAKRLYGEVEVKWAKPFVFSPDRGECRAWFARGMASIGGDSGTDYDVPGACWPRLLHVERRGNEVEGRRRVFQWSDGSVFEQEY